MQTEVNVLDLAVVVLAVSAAIGGYRLGFVTRVVSWIGSAAGLFVALKLLPVVLGQFHGGEPVWMLGIALAVVLGGLTLGQSAGFAVGARLRPLETGAGGMDRAAGAAAGIVGVLLIMWLMLPILRDVPGGVAEQVRSSQVAHSLAGLPDPPDSMQALRSFMGEDNFPQVFSALRPTPDLGPPPEKSGLTQATADRVRRSVVKVEGVACGRVQNGTGFVVDNELVATNAHVVAGELETDVLRNDGSRARAAVVAFDPDRDLALLRVPGLARPPLPIGQSSMQSAGGVFGHPGGGPLEISPFTVANRLRATGRNIYGTGLTTRDILELSSGLRPGDSGSALVDPVGMVVGVAFAIAPDNPDVAYALSTDELRAVLMQRQSEPVGTGRCASA